MADPTRKTNSGAGSLPGLPRLIGAAIAPNAALMALALVTGHGLFALDIAAGLAVALLMYSGIYGFVSGISPAIRSAVGGRATPDSKPFLPIFALVSVGKFVVLAAIVYVLVCRLHANVFGCLAGFLIAQIAVTVVCAGSLASTPLLSRGLAAGPKPVSPRADAIRDSIK